MLGPFGRVTACDEQGRIFSRRQGVVLLRIILFGAAIRTICFSGFAGSDDGAYAEIANGIAKSEFSLRAYTGPPVFPLRLEVILPLAFPFKLFGPSEPLLLLLPMAVSLSGIILAYLAGQMLGGPRTGMIAGGLYAVTPLDVRFGTLLTADALAAFWLNVSVLLLYVASGCERVGSRAGVGILAGLMLVSAWTRYHDEHS
jgi:4-amino-4-deoxy-L-arabinose transferase-like glycosyltransferase